MALDRIRIDRTHIAGSIDPVNPIYINKVEQIHAVDWDRRRRFQSTAICSNRRRVTAVPASALSRAMSESGAATQPKERIFLALDTAEVARAAHLAEARRIVGELTETAEASP